MKKILAIVLACVLCIGALAPASAEDTTESRVTVGADLTSEQKAQIYRTFGLEPGVVEEITVTNAEEREYLEGIASESRLGNVALSSSYITILEPGEGLQLEISNINWVTKEMYESALITANITDAKVVITAPYELSGTAALTGIYKAFEDIRGAELNAEEKDAAVKELITTAELADFIGSEEATRLINELKKILDNIKVMTDDEVRAEIRRVADEIKIQLSDDQVEQVLQLLRVLQNLDTEKLQGRLLEWLDTFESAAGASDFFASVWEGILSFFTSIGDFFKNLFGG